jgi:hypothetical protein
VKLNLVSPPSFILQGLLQQPCTVTLLILTPVEPGKVENHTQSVHTHTHARITIASLLPECRGLCQNVGPTTSKRVQPSCKTQAGWLQRVFLSFPASPNTLNTPANTVMSSNGYSKMRRFVEPLQQLQATNKCINMLRAATERERGGPRNRPKTLI